MEPKKKYPADNGNLMAFRVPPRLLQLIEEKAKARQQSKHDWCRDVVIKEALK